MMEPRCPSIQNSAWNAVGGGGAGGSNVTVGDTAPSTPASGDLWWDSAAGRLLRLLC